MTRDEFLAALKGGSVESAASPPPAPMEARRLLDHFADYSKKHTFKPGDLVRIKPGLNMNYKYPRPGRPGVVATLLSTPLPACDTSAPLRGLMADIRVGVLDDDGDFVTFIYPSDIFEPYDGPVEDGASPQTP